MDFLFLQSSFAELRPLDFGIRNNLSVKCFVSEVELVMSSPGFTVQSGKLNKTHLQINKMAQHAESLYPKTLTN